MKKFLFLLTLLPHIAIAARIDTTSPSATGIGSAVVGGTPGSALYIDASGNLGQDNPDYIYTPSIDTLAVPHLNAALDVTTIDVFANAVTAPNFGTFTDSAVSIFYNNNLQIYLNAIGPTLPFGAGLTGTQQREFVGGGFASPLFIRPDVNTYGLTDFDIMAFGSDENFVTQGLPERIYWRGATRQFTFGSPASGLNYGVRFEDPGVDPNTFEKYASLHIINSNDDYTNTAGAGSHLLLDNPTGTSNVISFMQAGVLVGKWRVNNAGDITNVAYSPLAPAQYGRHYFFINGDYPVGQVKVKFENTGNIFGYDVLGLSGSAYVTMEAGTAAAGRLPMRFTSGTLNTVPVTGAVEFLTDKWYGTINTGAARKEFTLNDIALTSGRVPFSTTNGRLTDSPAWTYSTATGMNVSTITASSMTVSGQITMGTSTVRGKLTVMGALDPISVILSSNSLFPGTTLYFESGNGGSTAVSAANKGRIIYNTTTQSWQLSSNGSTYATISTVTSAGGSSDNLGSHIATKTITAGFGIAASTGDFPRGLTVGPSSATVGGTLFSNAVSTTNLSTTQTVLYTNTMAANTLTTAGESIDIFAAGKMVDNINGKTVIIKFGNVTIATTTGAGLAGRTSWNLQCKVMVVSASSQHCYCTGRQGDSEIAPWSWYTPASVSLTGAVDIQLLATGGATNDITGEIWKVKYER